MYIARKLLLYFSILNKTKMKLNLMKKKIIVAGGAGFIGYHLIKRLLEDGESVVCVDNLSTGAIENVQHFSTNTDYHFIQHDIVEPLEIDDEVKCVYNLACPASPVHYQKDSVQTLQTSVWGVYHLLRLAHKKGCPLLQTSTSEVYGDPIVEVQSEEYWGNVNPVGNRSCYDEGKRCAETLCMNYHRALGVPVKIVRIFNTYGTHMRTGDGRVIPNFITQAIAGSDITIYGDGNQTRSLMYVDDLIEGMIRMMHTDDSVTGPVNLGNPDEKSIKDIADMIIRATSSNSRTVYTALPSDDPRRRCPDISKANMLLDWVPKVGLVEGLERTIAYFRNSRT